MNKLSFDITIGEIKGLQDIPADISHHELITVVYQPICHNNNCTISWCRIYWVPEYPMTLSLRDNERLQEYCQTHLNNAIAEGGKYAYEIEHDL